jgi:hypothetical protein
MSTPKNIDSKRRSYLLVFCNDNAPWKYNDKDEVLRAFKNLKQHGPCAVYEEIHRTAKFHEKYWQTIPDKKWQTLPE